MSLIWPLSTFVATQDFGSYRSNSGRAANIEPTLMTHNGHEPVVLRRCQSLVGD